MHVFVKSLGGHTLCIECAETTSESIGSLKHKIAEQALSECGESWPAGQQKLIWIADNAIHVADDDVKGVDENGGGEMELRDE